jgi:signal transduction histidine kinase
MQVSGSRASKGPHDRRLAPRSAGATAPSSAGPAVELRAVIEAMPEAVLICDAEDRVRIANGGADRLFAGRPVHDLDDLRSRFDSLPAGTLPDKALTARPRHQPNRWFEIRSVHIGRGEESDAPLSRAAEQEDAARGGRDGGQIVILRDVTSTHEEKEERRAFLSILSHELRTPITTIYAGSRVLARRRTSTTRTIQATQDIAADISAEAAKLYDVVEDLLVLTRVEQGVLDLSEEPVLLQRIVETTTRVIRSRRADVPFVVEGAANPPAVRADPLYVEQVVRNLVSAAARFGGPSSPVVIRFTPSENEVSVSVLDRGPDLTADELASSYVLTDPPAGPRRFGPGIALFVCRRLVETMRGRVWVQPRQDGGAEFGFALPRYVEAD